MAAPRRLTVRERIDPAITASLFSNYRSSTEALLELVDNAIDSRLPRAPLEIELTVHPTSVLIHTQGGSGMGVREIERNYLRWGASPKRGKNLLGRYGQGGKAAIGHLGTRFTIEAARAADSSAWRFTDPDYRDRARLKSYEIEEVQRRVAGVGYFRIRIDGVDKRIDQRRLGQRLADAYRPLLEAGDLRIRLNERELVPEPLRVDSRRDFSLNVAGGRLKGWLGVADRDHPTPGWEPGVRCYKLGRLITEGEFFGHPSSAQVPALVRLMGEVDIPQVQLTMNKNDFERDSAAWAEVEARLHRLLAPLLKSITRDGEIPPPESAVRVAEQVRKLLGQALRLLDRPDLFAGSSPSVKPRADENRLPLELEPKVAAAPAPRPGATPPPGPGRPGRKGFGNVVIRALEPRTRSLTTVEGGVRIIVINSNYPLFRERRGHVWYQLETAIREIVAADDGSSVEDYEGRVSDLILAAGDLRQRRHRPAQRGSQLRLLGP